MRVFLIGLLILLFQPQFMGAQGVSALVIDAKTKEPIPFATVQFGKNNGVITNDEGRFSLNPETNKIDSLQISSLGYHAVKFALEELPVVINLQASNIELKDVFLTNKNLSGKEIIEKVKERINSNYNFDLTQKKVFFRESNLNQIKRFDLLVNKSTIPDLNQVLMDQVTNSVPKYSDSYKEILADVYGNYDKQKLKVIKAANLHDPQSTAGLQEHVTRLENIFRNNIKERSFLKIKSGIIGVKVDADEFETEFKKEKDLAESPAIKTPEEEEKESKQKQNDLKTSAAANMRSLLKNVFWKKDLPLNVFEKPNKYKFTLDGYTQIEDAIVYVIHFEPKRGAEFKGKMYINTSDFGVHRLDYENVKPLKKFRLFGISTAEDIYRGKMIFKRDENGKYNPGYLELEKGESVGIDRPLTIIEKNKNVRGKSKQNELDLDIKFNLGQVRKYQLVVYENAPLNDNIFNTLEVSAPFEYKTFKTYDPNFWSGYNIIEPNTAIKAFTVEEGK